MGHPQRTVFCDHFQSNDVRLAHWHSPAASLSDGLLEHIGFVASRADFDFQRLQLKSSSYEALLFILFPQVVVKPALVSTNLMFIHFKNSSRQLM